MRASCTGCVVFVLLSISQIAYAEQSGNNESQIEEIDDAPDYFWGEVGLDSRWQVITARNITYNGTFGSNDSVDVFALEISSTNGTIVELVRENYSSIIIQIQSLNQSSWTIVYSTNNGQINLSEGIHVVRVERLGDSIEPLGYRFTLNNLGPVESNDVVFEDLSWMFTDFYLIIGFTLILPFLVVMWWNRGQFRAFNRNRNGVSDHEKKVLLTLRERFGEDGLLSLRSESIEDSLRHLGQGTWDAAMAELGNPEIRHITSQVEVYAWKFGDACIIGMEVRDRAWELAAIRIYSPLGEETKVGGVEPEYLFQDDEVFIGDIEPQKTIFLNVDVRGNPSSLNMQLSGIVSGNPVAAVPSSTISWSEGK
ncbi:MAG: hypothetical protein QF911_04755 [Candidatus Thalassarchaeaceae archaeon]|jgi:hypothetical protein|nr:hypothetical protein [Candidatus Thalassarchaeaceae archaeon]